MYVRETTPTHVTRGRKHCKRMASLYKHMGKLQSAIILIQRHESTIPTMKFLVFVHSVHPYKNCVLKCSHFLHELFNYFLQATDTLSRKKCCPDITLLDYIIALALQCYTWKSLGVFLSLAVLHREKQAFLCATLLS